MAEMEQWVADTVPAIPLASPNQLSAVSNRVTYVPYETWMAEFAETKVN